MQNTSLQNQLVSEKLVSDIVHHMKYSKYIEEFERRESYEETVNRNVKMHVDKWPHLRELIEDAFTGVYSKQVLPSMRSFQFAGKAIERNPARIFNCSYLPVDHITAFREILFLLLSGSGVGFSVQQHHIAKLPEIMKPRGDMRYLIGDSIEGWADAVSALIKAYFQGKPRPRFEYSDIRPKGALLKTSGGRAPGHEKFKQSLESVERILQVKRVGSKLTSLECHDIICHVADAVISGGIRRSALISLFSYDDEEMLNAKKGEWWRENPQRGRSNNSSVAPRQYFGEKEFWHLWGQISDSRSGDPGIVWSYNLESGYNPCVTADTFVMTSEGPFQVSDLIHKQFTAIVDGESYETTEKGFWKTGTKKTYKVTLQNGMTLKLTDNHQLLKVSGVEREWVELRDLNIGDKLKISDHRELEGWSGRGTYNQGYLLGNLVGDGTFFGDSAVLSFWGSSEKERADYCFKILKETCKLRSDAKVSYKEKEDKYLMKSTSLSHLASEYGLYRNNKKNLELVEKSSVEFHSGFLKGLFDTDGSVQGTKDKGYSIRLTQNDSGLLESVQRMLLRYGINSKIFKNRRDEGFYKLPDGNGGDDLYKCKAVHELIISKKNIIGFYDCIGFDHSEKKEKLKNIIKDYESGPRGPYREKFEEKIVSIEECGVEDVYDVTVPGPNAFCANGIYAHNCVEASLDPHTFCNLVEINAAIIQTQEQLNNAARYAARLATMQSAYTDFHYLRQIWKESTERDALIGVSMTGIVGGNVLNLDLREAARIVREENAFMAKALGINKAARTTMIKPAGSTSLLLGGVANGIHAYHNEYYFKRITVNHQEPIYNYLMRNIPEAMEPSMEPGKEDMESFIVVPMKAPEGSVTRSEGPLAQLERIRSVYRDWIVPGHRRGANTNNISSTVNVRSNQWGDVGNWLWENKHDYQAMAVFPDAEEGGLDHPQLPLQDVTKDEYLKQLSILKDLDLTNIRETEDATDLQGEIACQGGACIL